MKNLLHRWKHYRRMRALRYAEWVLYDLYHNVSKGADREARDLQQDLGKYADKLELTRRR